MAERKQIMKYLKAEKVKDGWFVKITDTRNVYSYTDLVKLIKQQGLEVRTKFYKKDNGLETKKVVGIFAD